MHFRRASVSNARTISRVLTGYKLLKKRNNSRRWLVHSHHDMALVLPRELILNLGIKLKSQKE